MRAYRDLPSGSVTRAKELRKNATDAETRLWRALREAFPMAKWRRQVPVGPYFADFLSFGAKLVVEVDGGQHSEAAGYDSTRTRFIEREGYRVLRFWNNDVLTNTDGIITVIQNFLSQREREGAAKPRKGEGDPSQTSRSDPHPAARSRLAPLPQGEGK